MKNLLKQVMDAIQRQTQPHELLDPRGPQQTPIKFIWEPPIRATTESEEGFVGPKIPYRNPRWDTWKKIHPKAFEELLSGTEIASKETGVPQSLLMDIAGIESSGGQFMNQLSGGPGRGPFQFEPGQKYIPPNFNFNSATESARLAGKRIASGALSNWGYDANKQMEREGRNWGSVDNPNNKNGRLTDFYPKQLLNKFLSKNYKFDN